MRPWRKKKLRVHLRFLTLPAFRPRAEMSKRPAPSELFSQHPPLDQNSPSFLFPLSTLHTHNTHTLSLSASMSYGGGYSGGGGGCTSTLPSFFGRPSPLITTHLLLTACFLVCSLFYQTAEEVEEATEAEEEVTAAEEEATEEEEVTVVEVGMAEGEATAVCLPELQPSTTALF